MTRFFRFSRDFCVKIRTLKRTKKRFSLFLEACTIFFRVAAIIGGLSYRHQQWRMEIYSAHDSQNCDICSSGDLLRNLSNERKSLLTILDSFAYLSEQTSIFRKQYEEAAKMAFGTSPTRPSRQPTEFQKNTPTSRNLCGACLCWKTFLAWGELINLKIGQSNLPSCCEIWVALVEIRV